MSGVLSINQGCCQLIRVVSISQGVVNQLEVLSVSQGWSFQVHKIIGVIVLHFSISGLNQSSETLGYRM
jgi:hypothetical protein